jgi:hypothetical protein
VGSTRLREFEFILSHPDMEDPEVPERLAHELTICFAEIGAILKVSMRPILGPFRFNCRALWPDTESGLRGDA